MIKAGKNIQFKTSQRSDSQIAYDIFLYKNMIESHKNIAYNSLIFSSKYEKNMRKTNDTIIQGLFKAWLWCAYIRVDDAALPL